MSTGQGLLTAAVDVVYYTARTAERLIPAGHARPQSHST